MAAILPVEEHLELQITLVHRAPLLYPIRLANVYEEGYGGPLFTASDHPVPVLTKLGTEPRNEVRLSHLRDVFDQVFDILPAKLVDNALEVVESSIGIIALDGRLVVLLD